MKHDLGNFPESHSPEGIGKFCDLEVVALNIWRSDDSPGF